MTKFSKYGRGYTAEEVTTIQKVSKETLKMLLEHSEENSLHAPLNMLSQPLEKETINE
jgi:hypothetical protein